MSQPPGRMTMDTGANMEAVARARYFAFSQRRTMPPRCNPFGILFLVLASGLLFIGLTMTIISNWPGVTSATQNPLQIAGPILLAVGGLAFFVVIILVFVFNSREKTKWETKVTNMALERTSSISREPLMKENPDMQARYSGGSSVFDPQGQGRYSIPVNPVRSLVQPLPDPNAKDTKPDVSASFHDSSFDSKKKKVPTAMRVQKKRKGKRSENSSSGSVNQSYSLDVGEADLGFPGVFSPPRKSQIIQDGGKTNGYSNEVYESSHSGKLVGQKGDPSSRPSGSKSGSSTAVDPIRDAITRGAAQEYPPQALRVHIKAQPGTAVHITPSATPPRGGHPTRRIINTSDETEI